MSDIKPALTAEEWKEKGINIDSFHGFQAYQDEDLDLLNVQGELIEPEQRHALAALALYGQPFGFTREDVEAIRLGAERVMDYRIALEVEMEPEERAALKQLESLADRIEALLPTENGWTVVKSAEHVSGAAGGSFSATSAEPKPPPIDNFFGRDVTKLQLTTLVREPYRISVYGVSLTHPELRMSGDELIDHLKKTKIPHRVHSLTKEDS